MHRTTSRHPVLQATRSLRRVADAQELAGFRRVFVVVDIRAGEQLGLKTGDKIVKINGNDYEDFQEVIKPDVLLSQNSYYTVDRDGQEINIPIPGNFIENFNKKESAGNFVIPRIPAIVGMISEKSLAERVGLKVDDQFVEIDGHVVGYFDEVTKIVKSGPRDSISFKVKRGQDILSFKENFKDQKLIGFAPKSLDKKELAVINYGLGQSIGLGTVRAFDVIFVQLKAFRKIFSGEISFRKSLSGPIGMAQAYGGVWDWERFWRMTGLLSMVLAFMNLLPIPALDGGYVMFLLYEMVSGREPSEKFFETALKIGMAMLLVLMVFVFYNDIAKLITGG